MEEGGKHGGNRRDAEDDLPILGPQGGIVQSSPPESVARTPEVRRTSMYDPLDDVPWSVRRQLASARGACKTFSLMLESQADSPAQPAEAIQELLAGKMAKSSGELGLREGTSAEQPSLQKPRETDRERSGETRADVEQQQTGGQRRERYRPTERKRPAHRVHRGFDIRDRDNRGRSRERPARPPPRRQMTGHAHPARDLKILTWNVGGMPVDRLEETVAMMSALGISKVEVVALQEVSCPEGITDLVHGRGEERWHIVAGERKEEWRGRMIAIKATVGRIVQKEIGTHALGVSVKTEAGKVGVLNVHLPPKATVPETGEHMALWERMQALRQPRRIFAGDLNETFLQEARMRHQEEGLQHKTARGAMLLQWLNDQDMRAPEQQIDVPTYYPYNHLHQPRRLDYLFLAGIEEGPPGRVHGLRHLVSSDHDAVSAGIRVPQQGSPGQRSQPSQLHGARQLKGKEAVEQMTQDSHQWKGDNLKHLQQAAHHGTQEKPL